MQIFKAADQAFDPANIAVAINQDLNHVGILFKGEDASGRICDFQRDHKLRVAEVPPEYFWIRAALDARQATLISALVRLVIKRNPKAFPYSFVCMKRALSSDGRLKTGAGFTCVTFILAIFDAVRLAIIDASTWPSRPEDKEFRDRLLNQWGQEPDADLNLIGNLYGETITFRVKPIELFGATGSDSYPVSFTSALTLGAQAAAFIKNYKAA